MGSTHEKNSFITQLKTSTMVTLMTMGICCFLYPLTILGIGQMFVPDLANGSLVRDERGKPIGSRLIAQKFTRPEYFHARPSAVDYDAMSASGSNLSPTSSILRERAKVLITQFNPSVGNPIPADLITASGSGLDPNITLTAAKYQSERIALARTLPIESITELLDKFAYRPFGIITSQPLVNVLIVNIELDRLGK